MAKYDTRVLKKGSFTVTISKEAKSPGAGDRLEAFLKLLAGLKPVDPDYGVSGDRPSHPIAPGGGGGKPDQGLPGSQPGIDNSLPEPPVAPTDPVYPDNGLPEAPPAVDNTLPWLGENAKAIAKAILGKCFDCNTAQPK